MFKTILNYKIALFISIAKGLIALIVLFSLFAPQITGAQAEEVNIAWNSESLVKIDSLTKCGIDKASYGVVKTKLVWVTGYEPVEWQTDSTPRIAASGKEVFDGMVATNDFPFGTKIRIPEVFGKREFGVWDRMHYTKIGVVDVFMENGAKNFGARLTKIEILAD